MHFHPYHLRGLLFYHFQKLVQLLFNKFIDCFYISSFELEDEVKIFILFIHEWLVIEADICLEEEIKNYLYPSLLNILSDLFPAIRSFLSTNGIVFFSIH